MNLEKRLIENIDILEKFVLIKQNVMPKDKAEWFLKQHRNSLNDIKGWLNSDRKTFVLSKNLIELFNNTDIPYSEKPENFVFPFETFMIEGQTPLFHRLDNDSPAFNICVYTKDYLLKHPEQRKYSDDIDNSDSDFVMAAFYLLPSSFIGHSVCYCANDVSFIESFDVGSKGFKLIKNPYNTYGLGPQQLPDGLYRRIVNIVFNTILYLSDKSRNIEETEKHEFIKPNKKRMKHDNYEFKQQEFIYLTTNKNYTSLSMDSSGRKLESRFIVRGHWRNQSHGEKHSLHKWIQIKPYYKGPEFGQEINKPYLLKQ